MTQEEFIHIANDMRANAASVAQRFGFASDDAEDIAQDVMLKLWCLHEKVDDATRMRASAAITARHLCIDRWRTARRHEDMEVMMPVVDEDTLYDRLEYAELEQWMTEQIYRLPSTSRAVLTMRLLEHRNLSEIAEILGIRQTSASTLLSRARNELMKKLTRWLMTGIAASVLLMIGFSLFTKDEELKPQEPMEAQVIKPADVKEEEETPPIIDDEPQVQQLQTKPSKRQHKTAAKPQEAPTDEPVQMSEETRLALMMARLNEKVPQTEEMNPEEEIRQLRMRGEKLISMYETNDK